MVHRLQSGCGRRIHHDEQGQDPPQKWDDGFSAFSRVVQQAVWTLRWGKTVEKMDGADPGGKQRRTSRYGVPVYRKKAVRAYLLERPSGVGGLKDMQARHGGSFRQKQTSGGDYEGDWVRAPRRRADRQLDRLCRPPARTTAAIGATP